jgi:hypothetical protein
MKTSNECAQITKEYVTSLGGGPKMAADISAIVHPKSVSTQSVYNWRDSTNDPDPFFLWFVWKHTSASTALHEWAERCLIASGFSVWMEG